MSDHESVESADTTRPRPDSRAAALESALGAWAGTPDRIDVDAALARVTRERQRLDVAPSSPDIRSIGSTTRPIPWLRLAAALALVLGGAALWMRLSRPTAAAQLWATTTGTRQVITLADGSRVTLGPGSSLVARAGFGQAHREVELRGEAWFEVVHDARQPFTTLVGGTRVVDVGTAFQIRGTTSGVSVQVAEGEVRVEPATSARTAVALKAGDEVRVAGDSVLVARGTVDAADAQGLTRGTLVFRDASMAEVASAMQRWFGVHLVVPDAQLAGRHLTANFSAEPRARVLAVLGLTLGATIETRGDTVIVRPQERTPATR